MESKVEDIIPHTLLDGSKAGTQYFTLSECAKIAIDYSVAVLDYVNGQYETQINGELLKEKYDALFAKWLLEGATESAIARNALAISLRTDSEVLEELKFLANHRGGTI